MLENALIGMVIIACSLGLALVAWSIVGTRQLHLAGAVRFDQGGREHSDDIAVRAVEAFVNAEFEWREGGPPGHWLVTEWPGVLEYDEDRELSTREVLVLLGVLSDE